jgi:hypothetical protein
MPRCFADYGGLERIMSVVSTIFPADVDVIASPKGFLRGTRLMTPGGWRAVEELKAGDVVCCCREAPVVVSAITRRMVSRVGAKVVCVSGEARGWGRQATPLLLAVDQIIVVAGDQLAAYFGVEEALAPLGALVNGTDLRLIDAPPADMWFDLQTETSCALVAEGLQVAVGDASRDTRPVLSAAEARLLSLAA